MLFRSAISAQSIVHSISDEVNDALNRGVNIQVLLAKPESKFVEEVGQMEADGGREPEDRPREIKEEIVRNKNIFYQYMSAAAKGYEKKSRARNKAGGELQLGRISVRYFSTQLRANLVIIDEKEAWYTPYLSPRKSRQSASFHLLRRAGLTQDLISRAIEHFDTIWKRAENPKILNGWG